MLQAKNKKNILIERGNRGQCYNHTIRVCLLACLFSTPIFASEFDGKTHDLGGDVAQKLEHHISNQRTIELIRSDKERISEELSLIRIQVQLAQEKQRLADASKPKKINSIPIRPITRDKKEEVSELQSVNISSYSIIGSNIFIKLIVDNAPVIIRDRSGVINNLYYELLSDSLEISDGTNKRRLYLNGN